MAVVRFGPALAGFPAFPLLPLDAIANFDALPPEQQAQILATFQALNFAFTPTQFSFELNSAIFGVPGAFDYRFELGGDFTALAGDPSLLFAAFNPALAGNFLVRFQTAETRNLLTDTLAIAAVADRAGPPLPFLALFGTLLDPRNYTQDLLATFTGNLAQFDTLDLSAFTQGVVSARPNGPTISRQGTVSAPGGGFVSADWGVVSFNGEVLSLAFTTVLGSGGNDVLGAGARATTITAGGGDDLLLGHDFADTLTGEAGNDAINGNGGDDQIAGGEGHDTLLGGAGNDTLDGGVGDDLLVTGPGHDRIIAGSGADRIVLTREAGAVTTLADFDAGQDRLDLAGLIASPASLRFADSGADLVMTVRNGAVTQTVLFEGLAGQAETVRAAVTTTRAPGTIATAAGSALHGGEGADLLLGQGGDDYLVGRGGDDRIAGGDGNDSLFGGSGSDVLLGGADADRLEGGDGDDVLDGGDGDDMLVGGRGTDVLSGGYGADVFVVTKFDRQFDRISDFELGQDRIDLSALLAGRGVTADNWQDFVRLTPLGPTELTGFLAVDVDGGDGPAQFRVVAQLDGAPWAISNGQSGSVLTAADFIFG